MKPVAYTSYTYKNGQTLLFDIRNALYSCTNHASSKLSCIKEVLHAIRHCHHLLTVQALVQYWGTHCGINGKT